MEVKSIRERIEWDASSQEVEFRNVDYVNKNIGFKNCASEDTLKLNEVDWNNIVCLDVKFESFSMYEKKYEKHFQYIKKFLNSNGKKVFHPKILIGNENIIHVKEFINYFNKILDLNFNRKNYLELYVLFYSRQGFFRWEDPIIIELVRMINHYNFYMFEKNIQKKFI